MCSGTQVQDRRDRVSNGSNGLDGDRDGDEHSRETRTAVIIHSDEAATATATNSSSGRRRRTPSPWAASTTRVLVLVLAASFCAYTATTSTNTSSVFVSAQEVQGEDHHAHASVRGGDGARRLKWKGTRKEVLAELSLEKIAGLKSDWSKYTRETMNTTTAPDHPVRPFFGQNQQVHILQIGDPVYRAKHSQEMNLNELWTKCAGYQYHFKPMLVKNNNNNADHSPNDIKSEDCVYTQKVKVIRDFFVDEIPLGDWMIFVDLDAYFQAPNCDELERVLWRQQHLYDRHHEVSTSSTPTSTPQSSNTPHQCEVIAHTCHKGINSGIFLLKATVDTRALVERWYEHQRTTGFCTGPADQWALQEVMLEHYHMGNHKHQEAGPNQNAPSPLEECLALSQGPTAYSARGRCSAQKLLAAKAVAFDALPKVMKSNDKFETVPLGRNMCVFDCQSSRPLQCHDCEGRKLDCLERQPLFHHHWFFVDGVYETPDGVVNNHN